MDVYHPQRNGTLKLVRKRICFIFSFWIIGLFSFSCKWNWMVIYWNYTFSDFIWQLGCCRISRWLWIVFARWRDRTCTVERQNMHGAGGSHMHVVPVMCDGSLWPQIACLITKTPLSPSPAAHYSSYNCPKSSTHPFSPLSLIHQI